MVIIILFSLMISSVLYATMPAGNGWIHSRKILHIIKLVLASSLNWFFLVGVYIFVEPYDYVFSGVFLSILIALLLGLGILTTIKHENRPVKES